MTTGLAQRAVQGRGSERPELVFGEVHEERSRRSNTPQGRRWAIKSPNAVEATRWIRFAAECFANPGEFETPQEYLAGITECLVEACHLAGVDLPELPKEWVHA